MPYRRLDINRAIAAESSPLNILAAGLEPGTFGFRTKSLTAMLRPMKTVASKTFSSVFGRGGREHLSHLG